MRIYCLKKGHFTHEKSNLVYLHIATDLYTLFTEQFRAGLHTDGAAGRCHRTLG